MGETRIIVGITGASGAIFGINLLDQLRALGVEAHLVITPAGERAIAYETHFKIAEVSQKAAVYHPYADIGASIASGSFKTAGMVVAPCSVRSMSEIATGVTSNLLTRAADVTLKERRPLILLVRETPLHLGHLRTMTSLAEMGAVIAPPLPAFYSHPRSIEEMVEQFNARVLDMLGFAPPQLKRWGEDVTPSRPPKA